MKKIALVYCPDWMGVYVDGELQYANHSIQPQKLLAILGLESTEVLLEEEDMEKLSWELPAKLEELKLG